MTIDTPKQHHLPALRALWQEAFGDGEDFLDSFEETAFSADRCRCATVDGAVVAALYWFDCLHQNRRIAYLYAIATAKAYRGRGICRALLEDTHRHLRALGYEGAILVPGGKSLFELYEKLGYQICSRIGRICCSASEGKISLCQIGKNEYAKLRREFLPQGAVVQENENLDFLQRQAAFYTGEGFLLAARGDADTLYGLELLGNPDAAPAIVQSLGYAKGVFRAPGEDIPFAMYFPLKDSTIAPPSYFGLAFD